MTSQIERAQAFRAMHAGPEILILPNAWDAASAALMEMIDSVNHSGKGKIWFAGQGIEKPWAMKREMLSPAYTTRYADLPVAR